MKNFYSKNSSFRFDMKYSVYFINDLHNQLIFGFMVQANNTFVLLSKWSFALICVLIRSFRSVY